MNSRINALLIGFAATLTLTWVEAADKNNSPRAEARSLSLQALARGQSITSNKQQYQILDGVRAAESLSKEVPQQTLTRMGGSKMLETKGRFVVFTTAQGLASVTSVNGTSYPTALNSRTGVIGILPGTLSIKLKGNADAAALSNDYGLELVRHFAHLQTAFYRVKTGRDVVAAAASLNADIRVERAEVEVIEHMNVPH